MPDVSAIPVKMQGQFGTCDAYAGSFFDSKLQTDKRGAVQDLSPKYLWKQIKLIDSCPLDAGTDMRSIFKSLQNTGDCQEVRYALLMFAGPGSMYDPHRQHRTDSQVAETRQRMTANQSR